MIADLNHCDYSFDIMFSSQRNEPYVTIPENYMEKSSKYIGASQQEDPHSDGKEIFHSDTEFLDKIFGIIRSNLSDPMFGPAELEKLANMSHATLYRKLIENLGYSASVVIRKERVRSAMEKLKGTSLTSNEIAYRCGFACPAYFSKIFTKETGLSPIRWRKSLKKLPGPSKRSESLENLSFQGS